MRGLLACGGCGADLARGRGCALCSDVHVLKELGVARRRWRALPWIIASCLLLGAMAMTLDTGSQAQQARVGGAAPAGAVDVVVRPGAAAFANFTTEATAPVRMPVPAPQGIAWDVVAPPLLLLLAMGAKTVWIVCAPRRIAFTEGPQPVGDAPPAAQSWVWPAWMQDAAQRLGGAGTDTSWRHIALEQSAWIKGIAANMAAMRLHEANGRQLRRAWLETVTHRNAARPAVAPTPALRPGLAESWPADVLVRWAPWRCAARRWPASDRLGSL